jgi:hypothetical protein
MVSNEEFDLYVKVHMPRAERSEFKNDVGYQLYIEYHEFGIDCFRDLIKTLNDEDAWEEFLANNLISEDITEKLQYKDSHTGASMSIMCNTARKLGKIHFKQ